MRVIMTTSVVRVVVVVVVVVFIVVVVVVVVLFVSSSYSSGIEVRIYSFAPSSALIQMQFVKSLPIECYSGKGGTADPYLKAVGSNLNPDTV